MADFQRVVWLPDIHAPFVDGDALRTALAFVRVFKPHVLFLIGDVVDMYQVSNFDKDPERRFKLWDDLTSGYMVLKQVRRAAGNVPIYYISGNHEQRMQKYIRRVAPELHGLPALEVPKLLNLDEMNIKYVEEGSMLWHGLLVKHGNLVRARSGYTATGEMEKAGISGISGHTHRLSQIYKRNYSGMSTWVECGCLCDLNPEYGEGQILDWQHGLAYGYYEPQGNRFTLHTLPIIKNKCIFDGRLITA